MDIDLIRPDDLLNLHVEAVNLRLDADDPDAPDLVVEDPAEPAFLVVTFPPQAIAERAYFEAAIVPGAGAGVQPEPTSPARPDADAGSSVIEPLDPPGQTTARTGRPSRLVFEVPPEVRIPFSTEGLLDWSALTPSLHPIAAIGPDPAPSEIAQAPALRAPAPHETALELPFRLVISPNADATWAHRARPFTARGRTELWHTRLQLRTPDGPAELSRTRHAPLRAVWALDPGYHPTTRPDPLTPDPALGRTALSADDRYQLVVLTSAFHGYEVDAQVVFADAFLPAVALAEIPAVAPALGAALGAEGDVAVLPALDLGPDLVGGDGLARPPGALVSRLPRWTRTFPYVPEPFEAEQLMLSPLGGWLRSRGNWSPPREAKPSPWLRQIDQRGAFERAVLVEPRLFIDPDFEVDADVPLLHVERELESLDLSEWVHTATLGRDHYVRVVYEGELLPTHHPAALIKETQRTFKEVNGLAVAYLVQRTFVVVRQPVVDFADRGNPFRRVRLTTLVTPDLADPAQSQVVGSKRSFWVKVMTSATASDLFQFHAVGTDQAGSAVDATLPMLFVSKSDAEQASLRDLVVTEYNRPEWADARRLRVPGQTVTFAPADPATDNTRLVTRSLSYVVGTGSGPPQMLKADVRVRQVEELLGTDAPTTIRYVSGYVTNGFDAQTGAFAEVVRPDLSLYAPDDPSVRTTAGVTFSSDQAGGFATPNLGVSTLTRRLGPLAGTVEQAQANAFDPASFFKGVTAQLFGSFDLIDLLPAGSLDQNAPKMRIELQDGGATLVVTLDWEPEIQNVEVPSPALSLAQFVKGPTSKLLIHGVITKPTGLGGGPPAGGGTSDFTGTLNDFRVGILKSVFLNFDAFRFHARSGQKTDFGVDLNPGNPLEFGGDLTFVEAIRQIIPPGLFGDGASLDVTADHIRAGFSIGLPPVTVGVLSLKDVSLGAALTLPFADGKPVFDFNVSERARPFLLAVSFFGGGGFFHLQVDTAGIRQLEAALEFGAVLALDIGVATGEVHAMAGIYFSMQRKEPGTDLVATLTGYLRLGGSLSVLGIVKVSVEFMLSFTYDGGQDKAYGRATLIVRVSVFGIGKSVELTVERGFGGQSGDPTFGDLITTPEDWSAYALAFA